MNGREWKIPLFAKACPVVATCAFSRPSSTYIEESKPHRRTILIPLLIAPTSHKRPSRKLLYIVIYITCCRVFGQTFSWISWKATIAYLNTSRLFKKRMTKPFCWLIFPALTVWSPSLHWRFCGNCMRNGCCSNKKWEAIFNA